MPDGRTFTEGETYSLIDDGIKRETAARDTRISELEGENTSLKNAKDVLETEKASETQRADQAAQALIDYKDGIEQEKAREELRTSRLATVAEATTLLEMTEERANRIVAMDTEAFDSFVSDLREIAAKAPKPDPDAAADAKGGDDNDEDDPKKKKGFIPRESAAFGGSTTDAKSAGSVKGLIGASRSLRAGAEKKEGKNPNGI